jgi:hypothetical protein
MVETLALPWALFPEGCATTAAAHAGVDPAHRPPRLTAGPSDLTTATTASASRCACHAALARVSRRPVPLVLVSSQTECC